MLTIFWGFPQDPVSFMGRPVSPPRLVEWLCNSLERSEWSLAVEMNHVWGGCQHRRVVTHRPEKKTHRSRSQALPLSQSTKGLHDFGLSCPGEPICSGSLRKWRSGIVKYYRWYRINTTCTNMNHIICNVCIYIHIYIYIYYIYYIYININIYNIY